MEQFPTLTCVLTGEPAAPARASLQPSGGSLPLPSTGSAPAAGPAAAGPPAAAGEHEEVAGPHPKPEELAGRLLAAGPGGVDQALLAAAAKALRDVIVLDRQLLRARLARSPHSRPLLCYLAGRTLG